MFQTHSKLRSTENYVINSHSKQKLCCFCCCSSTIRTASALTKMAFRCKRFYVSLFFQPENICIYVNIFACTECKPKHAPIDGCFCSIGPQKCRITTQRSLKSCFDYEDIVEFILSLRFMLSDCHEVYKLALLQLKFAFS